MQENRSETQPRNQPTSKSGGKQIGSVLGALLNLRPRILQANRPIEDGLPRRRIRVYAKVAEAFELILRAGHYVAQAWLDFAGGQHF